MGVLISDGSGTRNLGFGSAGEIWAGLRQVEQAFSSFFAKFLPYFMIFQSGALFNLP